MSRTHLARALKITMSTSLLWGALACNEHWQQQSTHEAQRRPTSVQARYVERVERELDATAVDLDAISKRFDGAPAQAQRALAATAASLQEARVRLQLLKLHGQAAWQSLHDSLELALWQMRTRYVQLRSQLG